MEKIAVQVVMSDATSRGIVIQTLNVLGTPDSQNMLVNAIQGTKEPDKLVMKTY